MLGECSKGEVEEAFKDGEMGSLASVVFLILFVSGLGPSGCVALLLSVCASDEWRVVER